MTDLSITSNLLNTQNSISKKEASNQIMQHSLPIQQNTKKEEKYLTDEQKWVLGIGTVAALGIAAYCILKGKGKQAGNQLQKAKENISGASKNAHDTLNTKPQETANKMPTGRTSDTHTNANTSGTQKASNTVSSIEESSPQAVSSQYIYLSGVKLDQNAKDIVNALYSDSHPKTPAQIIQALDQPKELGIINQDVFFEAKRNAEYLGGDLSDIKSIIERILKKDIGIDITADIKEIRSYDPNIANLILMQNRGTKLNSKTALKKLIDKPLKDEDGVLDITHNSQGGLLEKNSDSQKIADKLIEYYKDLFHILNSDSISKSNFENILKIRTKIAETQTNTQDLINEVLQAYQPK